MDKRTANMWYLYQACKQWVRDESWCFADHNPTLVEVWNRARLRTDDGLLFRSYVVNNYEKFLEYGED